MKLHQDTTGALNVVTGYGPDWIEVNRRRHDGPILLLPEGDVQPWEVSSFDALAPEHFAGLMRQRPEIVLLGTGRAQRFPHPRLTVALAEARVGIDAMTTQAACRTFNILAAEGRRVLAALLSD